MAHSTRKRRKPAARPKKPYAEFPLYAHPLGYWSARVDKSIFHFGRWGRRVNGQIERLPYEESWRDALKTYKARIDDVQAGRVRETVVSALPINDLRMTVAELCNHFRTSKMRKMQAGELTPRSYAEYKVATDLLVARFGKSLVVEHLTAGDFEALRAAMAESWGPARLAKFVGIIRSVFKYGIDNGLLDRPVMFGSAFKKPSKAILRKHKAEKKKKLFAADELRLLLDALTGREVKVKQTGGKAAKVKLTTNPQLRAIVLLAVNAGLGNTDISGLQFSHLDLDGGWLDYPRIKTGLPRRAPLWPETVTAIRASIRERKPHKLPEDADCVFINRAGHRLVVSTEKYHQDYVSSQFRTALKELGMNGHRGFYSIRHTYATIGLQHGDRDAVRYLMGHAAHDMLSVYDETGPSDERLQAVVAHTYQWLFGVRKAK